MLLWQVRLQELAINLDYKLDESYTPNKISVRAGTSVHDLKEIRVVELNEPIGWVKVPLQPPYSSCVTPPSATQLTTHSWTVLPGIINCPDC